MPERTQKEIDAEIKALEACKEYVPKQTSFGESNIRYLEVQIQFLRDGIDTTAAEFYDDFDEREQGAILEAENWKNGDESEAPSAGWDNWKAKSKKAAKK